MAHSARQSSTGTKRTASAVRSSRSSASSRRKKASQIHGHHVVCVFNDGYRASLERRKIYVALADKEADRLGMARVIDESGEDYLYPKAFFADIKVPPLLAKTLATAT
jgi:hypothetical protein